MNCIGIDFGTTNSLVSQINSGIALSGLDALNRPTPSAIAYGRNSHVCGQAARKLLSDPDYHLVRSPKRCLATGSIFAAGREISPVEIIRDSLIHILSEAAKSPHGLDLSSADSAIVTVPVTMSGWQRGLLRDAFEASGLKIQQFLYEPFAALYAYFRSNQAELARLADKPMLVVDWGGGTLDLTICRLKGNRLTQIASAGLDDAGGDVIDEMIFNHAVQEALRQKGLAEYKIAPGGAARLLAECESAKISLSTRNSAIIYSDLFFEDLPDNSVECRLTREKLAEICAPVFNRAIALIKNLLAGSGLGPEQIGLCLAIGGMTNIPAIAATLNAMFGPERAKSPDERSTLVAEGAAWFAHDQAELLLAKNVEVELARHSFFRLLKSGSSLPSSGNQSKSAFVKLYCVDPRDGTAKIAICQPCAPGRPFPDDPRKQLELLSVQVDDRARPYFEDISLKYHIDSNLVLHVSAVSSHAEDSDEAEIHNLEFAVDLPLTSPPPNVRTADESAQERPDLAGSLRMRSNVVDSSRQGCEYYIPGDLLYRLKPDLFDVRNDDLPLIQRDERNYGYLKCALCGRKLHDPACQCNP